MYTILGVIAKPLGMLLNLLYGFVQNYGLTIIIFTLIVKLCLYPLYIKQTKSTARMSEVQPKMQALQRQVCQRQGNTQYKDGRIVQGRKIQPDGRMSADADPDADHHGAFCFTAEIRCSTSTDDSMIFAFHESFAWITT